MTITQSLPSKTTAWHDSAASPLVIVVLPTYNEADNLPAMTAALLDLPVENLQIIIVDDASPDGTGQIADRLAMLHPDEIQVIHRRNNRGLGRAYIEGFKKALDLGADFVVQMDADFSHSPQDIPRLLAAAQNADVAIGSRYVSGGELDVHWNWWRRFLSWWANRVYTQTLLGISVSDATAGFKCWRRATLEGIGLERIQSNGYIFQVEMSYVSERLGYRAVEVPIYFEDRRIGQSKMTMAVKLEAAWRVFEIRWRYRRLSQGRPAVLEAQQGGIDAPQAVRRT